MKSKRIHALVYGRVQGVFFRDYTCREAKGLGLHGWVRNLPTGSVETEFEGPEEQVHIMLEWLMQGSPLSNVASVKHEVIPATGEDTGFEVRY